MEVLSNHIYRVKRSEQIFVQSEKLLKKYLASPTLSLSLKFELARQPISRGRTVQPQEWEITIHGPNEVYDAPVQPSQSGPLNHPPLRPVLVALGVTDISIVEVGRVGPTPSVEPAEHSHLTPSLTLAQNLQIRKPPKFLDDY